MIHLWPETTSDARPGSSIRTCAAGLLIAALCVPPNAALAQSDQRLTREIPSSLAAIGARSRLNESRAVTDGIAQQRSQALRVNDKLSPLLRSITARQSGATGRQLQSSQLLRTRGVERVQVYVALTSTAEPVLTSLRALGAEIELINSQLSKAQLWIPASRLDQLAALETVREITLPKYATSRAGSINSEGVAILRSNRLQQQGFRGQGIRVGIVSDGANNLADAQASGNLPAGVTRFGSCSVRNENISACLSRKTCNEGTAMAEIIHDLAPDARLAVAAVSTSLEFIDRINQLANQFKADIIVDDLGFFGEPYFADGDLAIAVANLPSNVLYVSSAGNSGNTHYEKNFSPQVINGAEFHAFAQSDTQMGFINRARSFTFVIMQWNDPFDAPQADYDMSVLNQQGGTIGVSVQDQGNGARPIEAVCAPNTSSSDTVNFLTVDRFNGPDRRLEVFFLGAAAIEHSISAGSVFGHAATSRAMAVGAINASEPGNDQIAFYSSRGPARIDFPARVNRKKPDITAIDGVSVSAVGGFFSPFFGTSAAAPHVAGIAAQLMSVSKNISAGNVKRALSKGAVDLGAKGVDSIYGAGRVDALNAQGKLSVRPLVPLLFLLEDEAD